MKVAIVGAGAVGGYFGARLAAAGHAVHFLARGRRLEALRAGGLHVQSPHGDLHLERMAVTDDAAAVGPCELVLVCVKAYDTEAVAHAHLPHLVGEDGAVVSLQNGIDNEEQLAAVVGAGHVLGGLALIFAHLAAPGQVVHSGGPARIVLGELDGAHSPRTARLAAALAGAGVDVEVAADVRAALWDKLAFICAQGGTTAATRLPLGDIRATPATWALFRGLAAEVYAVAHAEGVAVAPDALAERLAFAERLEPGTHSSLYDDLVAGRRMELDALHGAVLRRARRHRVPSPLTEAVYAVLAPWAARHARAAGPG
jgi:2-dehydropantoate 2-reductase